MRTSSPDALGGIPERLSELAAEELPSFTPKSTARALGSPENSLTTTEALVPDVSVGAETEKVADVIPPQLERENQPW